MVSTFLSNRHNADTAVAVPLDEIRDVEVMLTTLKATWTDVNSRSDKSAVYESAPLRMSRIATMLAAILSGLKKIRRSGNG